MRRVVFIGSVLGTSAALSISGLLLYLTFPSEQSNFLLAIIGIYLAIVIPIGAAYFNQPDFDIVLGDPVIASDGSWQIVKVKVVSKRNLVRDPRPQVTFEAPGNTEGFGKITIPGKWDSAPEPILFWEDSRAQHYDFQGWLTRVERSLDIFPSPSEGEELAIAIKFRGEQEFYGFDSWSYQHGKKHPSYKIAGLKSVRVNVEVTSGDVVKRKSFVVENPDTELLPSFVLRDDKSRPGKPKKPQQPKKLNMPEKIVLTIAVLAFAAGLTAIGIEDQTTWKEDVGGAGGFLIADYVIRWFRSRRTGRLFEVGDTPEVAKPALGFAGFFIIVFAAGDVILAVSTFSRIVYGGQLEWVTIAAYSLALSFGVASYYIENLRRRDPS